MTSLRLLFLLALTGFLLSACKRDSETTVQKANRAGVLLLANGGDPQTLDPQIATGLPENNIITCLMEGLTATHPSEDSAVIPGVAERWEEEDNRVWTFYLRKDSQWSDGTPITASDFVKSWRRILDPALASQYAELLHRMKGARAFHKGETTDFSTVGCQAVEDHVLRVELESPTSFFPELLAHYSWFPVPIHVIEQAGELYDRNNPWAKVGTFVGNGPFNLASWDRDNVLKTAKSDTYWDKDVVTLNEIHFFPIEEENTAERMFRSGELHATDRLPLAQIPVYEANYPDKFRSDANYGTYFYRLNTREEILSDHRVRHALSMAIDRKALVEKLYHGQPRVATGFTCPGAGYEPPEGKALKFDPEYARNLLKAAGYPGGEGFPTTQILINTSEDHKSTAEVVQANWKEHLGINVTIHNASWDDYLEKQRQGQYQISRAGWNGDYVDPTTFLEMFVKDGGNNETGWDSPAYDRLLLRAQSETDPQKRFATLREAEEILLHELPILPIYWYRRYRAVDPSVINWNAKLLDHRPFKHVSLEGIEAPVATAP